MTEKLDELKNRISLTLKEETLQQGFEIICKKLSELEESYESATDDLISVAKERDELKQQIEKMKCCGNCSNYYLGEDKFYRCKTGSFFISCNGKNCKNWRSL